MSVISQFESKYKNKPEEAIEQLEKHLSAHLGRDEPLIYKQLNYMKALDGWRCLAMPMVAYKQLSLKTEGLHSNPAITHSMAILQQICYENDFDFYQITGATDGQPFPSSYAMELYIFLCYLIEARHDLLSIVVNAITNDGSSSLDILNTILDNQDEKAADDLFNSAQARNNKKKKSKNDNENFETKIVLSPEVAQMIVDFADKAKNYQKLSKLKKLQAEIEGKTFNNDDYVGDYINKAQQEGRSVKTQKTSRTVTSKVEVYDPKKISVATRTTAFIEMVHAMTVVEFFQIVLRRVDLLPFTREKINVFLKAHIDNKDHEHASKRLLYPKYKRDTSNAKKNWLDYENLYQEAKANDNKSEVMSEMVI